MRTADTLECCNGGISQYQKALTIGAKECGGMHFEKDRYRISPGPYADREQYEIIFCGREKGLA